MTATLAHIWRHPIKSHGREALGEVNLTPGQTLPWDRHWAVAHARTKFDPAVPVWMPCANFALGSSNPALRAIDATLDEATATVTLTHPDLAPLQFAPDQAADQARFLAWVVPLLPADKTPSTQLVRVPGRGMTDTDYPSISLCNLASNQALGGYLGATLSPLRWRGNLWIDGLVPWAECSWPGQDIRIGDVVLRVREPIKRCKATAANPATGIIDIDTLAGLRSHTGTQDFGVYAEVHQGGIIRLGDRVEVLA